MRVLSSSVPRRKAPSPGLRPASPKGRGKIDNSRLVEHIPCRTPLTSCPTFLGAEPGEAEVRQLPRVLIGGILPPGGHCYRKAPAEAAGPVVPTNVSFTPLRVQSLRLLHFLGFEHPFGKAKGIGERSRSL